MIYLIAPYSTGSAHMVGISHQERMRLRAAEINKFAAKLMEDGELVYSPISHGVSLEPHLSDDKLKDHQFWMEHCFGMLDLARSAAVLRLPGWDKSVGVGMEMSRARARGIPVFFFDPEPLLA